MRKILKWIGYGLVGLVGLAVLVVGGLYLAMGIRIDRTYAVPKDDIVIKTDAESVARGKHLVEAMGHCQDCHGDNFAGKAQLDDPVLGQLYSANLTRGRGGVGATFGDADWIRVMRHGVAPNGRSVISMPSQAFYFLSDEDLGSLIAYLRMLPPVDNVVPPRNLALARFGLLNGQLSAPAAELIDHSTRPPAPPQGVTADYGNYIVSISNCRACHGPALSGGPILGAPANTPSAPNLTPRGIVAGWTEADFIATVRTGIDPRGYHLSSAMPYRFYRNMTDDELRAVWAYLQTLFPKEYGEK
ncbi:MAG: c-type cytochrome [Anaerolineae bacterium]